MNTCTTSINKHTCRSSTPSFVSACFFLRYSDQVDPSKSYDRLAEIYYDAIEERIAIHEHEREGQQRDSYDEIALYQKVNCSVVVA